MRRWWIIPLLLVLIAAGCGGGGGGGNFIHPFFFNPGSGTTEAAPTVSSVSPANGATGVALNTRLLVTFSETMAPSSFTPATFTLTGPGATPVSGTLTGRGATATFTPANALAASTLFTATITTGVKNLQGTDLTSNFVWTFTTGTTPNTTAPTVSSTVPANNATGVAVNSKLLATFSTAMDPTTITPATFTLTGPGSTPVAGTVTYVGITATFTPLVNLAPSTVFTATITTGARDLAENALANNFVWTFTTGAVANTTPPTVISTIPANQATGVLVNSALLAAFSTAMDPTTITTATFLLTGPGSTSVAGTVTYVGTTATFTPTAHLAASTLFTATITTGAKDLAGNALASNFVWTFTTGATVDTTPPTITLVNPLNQATAVSVNTLLNATFSTAMNPLSITTATFTLTGPGSTAVAGTVTYNLVTNTATFTPTANLAASTLFTATITTGAQDLTGNALASNFVWTFTTGTTPFVGPAPLGTAAAFGSFGGGAGMTNQGLLTVVNGDIGTTGASTTITGFQDTAGDIYTVTPLNDGIVNGAIDTAPPAAGGTGTEGNAATFAIAKQGAADTLTAYNDLVALPAGADPGAGQLGGLTLAPGTYTAAGGSFLLTGSDLTLDAHGNANATWVFQMATSLTVGAPAAPRSIILANGAQAGNVFWQVGSAATINGAGGGTMVGTIIASAGVTISTAGNLDIVTLNGRALGLNASVTIVNTVINTP